MGRVKQKRSSERFAGIPHWVLKSAAYRDCSHAARSLLLDVVMQHNTYNNGKLVICDTYLQPLGWNSDDTVNRGKKQLLACGLLVETRKGARPNKAAWYALGWRRLEVTDGLDIDPHAYRTISQLEINSPTPDFGVKGHIVAPKSGAKMASSTPNCGAIRGSSGDSPTPKFGDCLSMPCRGFESPASSAIGAVE